MHRTLACLSIVRRAAVDPLQMHRWQSSELSKILVNETELTQTNKVDYPVGPVLLPKYLAYGLGSADSQKVFSALPELTAKRELFAVSSQPTAMTKRHDSAYKAEQLKANLFARAVDLRNADADGIAYENRRRIILAFSSPENPYDTGRTEVQAALLTYRIRNCHIHSTKFPKDAGNKRSLQKFVHQRAKVLKYLRRTNRARYDHLLPRLGLVPEAVEGELIVK